MVAGGDFEATKDVVYTDIIGTLAIDVGEPIGFIINLAKHSETIACCMTLVADLARIVGF